MGQLRRRGQVWWIRYYRNGQRHEESSHSQKKQVAIDLLKIREGDIAKGLPLSAKLARFKFEDAAKDIQTEYTVNKRKTLPDLKRRLKLHLAPYFAGRKMASITTTDVLTYTKQRQEAKASNAEINRELAALKRMNTLAMQAGKLLHRPHIPMLKERNVRKGFFEREQFESVRKHLPEALRPVVTFAYITGWRVPSEVLTLQWHQVDLKAGCVRLEPGDTKNEDARQFYFAELLELKNVLEGQKAVRDTHAKASGVIVPWVFHRNGKPIRDFRDAWESACKAAGCPGKIPHDFRRTAVRNLVRAGVPERVAMQMTGHKTRSVFERYNIVSEGDLREASKRLNAL